METATRGRGNPEGTIYDAEVVELAYQRWLFDCRRNCAAVARLLKEDHPGLSDRTVRKWSEDGGWSARADRELRAVAGATNMDDYAGVVAGAAESIDALRRIVNSPSAGAQAVTMATRQLLEMRGYLGAGGKEGSARPALTPPEPVAELDEGDDPTPEELAARASGFELARRA